MTNVMAGQEEAVSRRDCHPERIGGCPILVAFFATGWEHQPVILTDGVIPNEAVLQAEGGISRGVTMQFHARFLPTRRATLLSSRNAYSEERMRRAKRSLSRLFGLFFGHAMIYAVLLFTGEAQNFCD